MTEALPVEMQPRDLAWIAQVVHQSYHTSADTSYWDTCPKSVCKYITDVLDAHDAHINAHLTPAFASEFPVTSIARPSKVPND